MNMFSNFSNNLYSVVKNVMDATGVDATLICPATDATYDPDTSSYVGTETTYPVRVILMDFALMQIQQEKKEKEITAKIQSMIDEQKKLLDEGLDINKDGDIIKVKKEWNENILADGGISYYKLNDKWYRVSVVGDNNDI